MKQYTQPDSDARLAVWLPDGDDPQAELLDAMSDQTLLDCMGPSWSAMTPAQRAAYGPPVVAAPRESLLAALDRDLEWELLRVDARLYRLGLILDPHLQQAAPMAPMPTMGYRRALARALKNHTHG